MNGHVLYVFAFDVANEIRTGSIGEVLSERPFPFEIRKGANVPRDVDIYRPVTIAVKGEWRETSVGSALLSPLVKVFEAGAVSISYEVPFQGAALADLNRFHDLKVDGAPLVDLAAALCRRVVDELAPYLEKPGIDTSVHEAYTVFCVGGLPEAEGAPVMEWIERNGRGVAALLAEEPQAERLADAQVKETLRLSLGYTVDDAVVIDWDSAFLVNRRGYFDDVLYVLELANLQIEEYRLFDQRLDRFTSQAYTDLERSYRRRTLRGRPERILRTLRIMRIDVGKMSDQVTNVTKFVGDWYLARVYGAARERFHLPFWQASVERQLEELDALYSMVRAELYERRMLILEAVIVALFVLDLAAILLG